MKARASSVPARLDSKKVLMYAAGFGGLATFRFGVREVFPDPVKSSLVFWGGMLGLFAFERWVKRMRKKWA